MAYANTRENHTYSYDPDEDYSKKMQEAAAAGDYAAAAQYEQQRNEKIQGEGLTQYQATNHYAQYLPKSHQQQMNEILDKIMNREEFSYNMDADALYQQYKDQYIQQGKLAMNDAIGQAAALTGGYGNSYAQSVGQQAYSQYLGRLNDITPELYTLARERYDAEGDTLLNRFSLLAARENTEYNRNAAQEEKAYNLALSMLQSGMMPSQAVLSASGLSMEDAQKIYDNATTPSYAGYIDTNEDDTIDDDGDEFSIVYGEGMDERAFGEMMRSLTANAQVRDASSAADYIDTVLSKYGSQMSEAQWSVVLSWLERMGG